VLATPPHDVKLLFDDEIRPAGGDLVIDSRGRSVLAAPAHRPIPDLVDHRSECRQAAADRQPV